MDILRKRLHVWICVCYGKKTPMDQTVINSISQWSRFGGAQTREIYQTNSFKILSFFMKDPVSPAND